MGSLRLSFRQSPEETFTRGVVGAAVQQSRCRRRCCCLWKVRTRALRPAGSFGSATVAARTVVLSARSRQPAPCQASFTSTSVFVGRVWYLP